MPLVTDEQAEKQEGIFLKYESTNTLIIKSNLFKVAFHYLKAVNKFVACHEKSCVFCDKGEQKRIEHNYFVNLNGQDGVMDIKTSVFFDINEIEKASKKDKRHIKWMILKSGSGLDTNYTTSKDENLTEEEIIIINENLELFNEKLQKLMLSREAQLEKAYEEQVGENIGARELETAPEGEVIANPEEVKEEDLPF